ncbi:unnamed protein product [Aureobasidium mustum]|uniref:non-specific serine/threonine protein kinase n=1 Tax=Aureobasidium mustum TaxID=2773714 RepID=A0A9N8K7M8_9PEZI|nr:unnamed protein product [Aureobasidium mustum]
MSTEPNVRKDKRLPDIQLPPGHIWQHERELGDGGEGTAHLWVHLDADQRVVERIVIKNTVTVDPDFHMIKEGPHEGEWLEVSVQQRLAPGGSTEFYTVPILAAQKVPKSTYGWRTYMPFYSKGDFERIINEHYAVSPLPEPFLWFVLHRMAKAAVAMDETFREEGRDRPVLVHQDIKPENIFMGHPGSLGRDEPYPVYPVAYLGDFGLSYLTPDDESWRQRLRGTPGYCAPEHDTGTTGKSKAKYNVPPESKTNIWEVGNCIMLAMTGNHGGSHRTDGYKFSYHDKWDYLRDLEPDDPWRWSGYSDDLIKTVEWCLMDTMHNRPTPQELLEQIEQLMPQHHEGMDRWGTFSWVKDKSREIDGPLASADAEEAEEPDADIEVMPGEKRKASSPAGSPRHAKRSKAEKALERRLTYVATIIKGRMPKPHDDDNAFRLDFKKALRYVAMDEEFDPQSFFDTAGPEPISFFELDTVADDGPAHDDQDNKGKAKETSGSSKDDGDYDEKKSLKSKPKPSPPADTGASGPTDGYDDDDPEDLGAAASGFFGGGDDDEEDFTKPTGASKSGSKAGKAKPKTPKAVGSAMDYIDLATPTPAKPKGSKAATTIGDFIDLATPTPVKPKGKKGAGTAESPIMFDSPTPVKKKGSVKSLSLALPPVTPPPAAKDKGTKEAPLTVGDTPAPADEDEDRHHSSPLGGKGKRLIDSPQLTRFKLRETVSRLRSNIGVHAGRSLGRSLQ